MWYNYEICVLVGCHICPTSHEKIIYEHMLSKRKRKKEERKNKMLIDEINGVFGSNNG